MERWQGRVALVTGASSGIGAETCRALAKHGMKVVGCARSVDKIEKIASEFPLGVILPVRCDLTKEEDILSMFKIIRSKYGRIDVCINNAGFSTRGTLLDGKTEDWQDMFQVNVLALCICTRESVALMQEKGIDDGQIIHISSVAGHYIFPLKHYYTGTKHMVRALTEGLREELRVLKSHIRVASISPGLVQTQAAYRSRTPAEAERLYASIECLKSCDIANAVISILQTPPHVDINDVIIRPVEQNQ